MSSAKLKTNGEWLIWARKTAHYNTEEIAKEIEIEPEIIKKWEKTGEISYKYLEKLAELYKRPTTIFFNDDEPEYPKEPTDFRTTESINISITPEIAFELRNARLKREILLNVIEESDKFEVPLFPFDKFDGENFENFPMILRDLIGLNNVRKKKFTLNKFIKKIESLGILVFEFYGFDPKELRGYALYYDKFPIIGINHRDSQNPKKFTLFHELAHLLIQKEGISNLNEYYFKNKDEVLCNKIAAETLVPSNLFKNISASRKWDNFSQKDIQHLANHFKVSKEVIVRRALTLKLITESQFNERREEFLQYISTSKKHDKKSETQKKEFKKENIEESDHNIGNYNKAVMSLRRNGEYFTKSLFVAYENGLINDIDLALNLDISLEVMRTLREILIQEKILVLEDLS